MLVDRKIGQVNSIYVSSDPGFCVENCQYATYSQLGVAKRLRPPDRNSLGQTSTREIVCCVCSEGKKGVH